MTKNEMVALVERLFLDTLELQEAVAQLGEPRTARWPYVLELVPHDDAFEYIEVDVRGRAVAGITLQLRSPLALDLDAWMVRYGPMSIVVQADRIIRLLMVEPPFCPGAIVLETTRDELVVSLCARRSDRASGRDLDGETLELQRHGTVELIAPPSQAALPFRDAPSAPPALCSHPSHPQQGHTIELCVPLPVLPDEPSVELPLIADEADELLPLATYATIKVSVLRAERPLVEILAEHGLDEVRWRVEERRRAAALSLAAQRGDFEAVRSVRQALHAARRAAQPTVSSER
jgi:hypothetical protein